MKTTGKILWSTLGTLLAILLALTIILRISVNRIEERDIQTSLKTEQN